MAKTPKMKAQTEAPEGDPAEGDAILKRMLQSKPKPHKDMVGKAAVKTKTKAPRKAVDRTASEAAGRRPASRTVSELS